MPCDIEQEFTLRMFDVYRQAKEEAGYTATIFYGMIHDNGGLATAKTLINARKPSDGYTALFFKGRLDITVEAVVVEEPEWHSLFTEEEIEKAKRRLVQYEYKFGSPRRPWKRVK
jgi:hypothetical protein